MTRMCRVELNRQALNDVELAFADGIYDLSMEILRTADANAPDEPPIGEGLVDRGAVLVYAGRKKVHQATTGGGSQTVRKPRGSAPLKDGQVLGIVGFGFPAMFNELGTVHQPARPFLTPAISASAPQAEVKLTAAMARRLRGERDPRAEGLGARIAAAKAAKAARSAGG